MFPTAPRWGWLPACGRHHGPGVWSALCLSPPAGPALEVLLAVLLGWICCRSASSGFSVFAAGPRLGCQLARHSLAELAGFPAGLRGAWPAVSQLGLRSWLLTLPQRRPASVNSFPGHAPPPRTRRSREPAAVLAQLGAWGSWTRHLALGHGRGEPWLHCTSSRTSWCEASDAGGSVLHRSSAEQECRACSCSGAYVEGGMEPSPGLMPSGERGEEDVARGPASSEKSDFGGRKPPRICPCRGCGSEGSLLAGGCRASLKPGLVLWAAARWLRALRWLAFAGKGQPCRANSW